MAVLSSSRLLHPPLPRPRGAAHRTAALYGHLLLPAPAPTRRTPRMKCSRAATPRSSSQQNGSGEQEVEMEADIKNEQQRQNQEEEEAAEEDLRSSTATAAEIKERLAALRAKEGASSSDLWGGVAEEIREIEWPAFRKVLGTTGVVLAVIAGSSVALLTVNAILAEISDRVFAGKGLQDFI